MNPTILTLLEIVGSFFLGIVLIVALNLIFQFYKKPVLRRVQQYKFLVPLLAGLAMLNFILINLIVADVLDPNRTLEPGVLAFVLVINVPFIVVTIMQFVISLQYE